MIVFFLFKQKTAYEMRISDWSSDVCSSDLVSMTASSVEEIPRGMEFLFSLNRINVAVSRAKGLALVFAAPRLREAKCDTVEQMRLVRSEEHTSELQSLMRISYAVFCLKHKKTERKNSQEQIVQCTS